jgi:hypothetical protein
LAHGFQGAFPELMKVKLQALVHLIAVAHISHSGKKRGKLYTLGFGALYKKQGEQTVASRHLITGRHLIIADYLIYFLVKELR